jgi:superfamily II DNA or RNA helicase
MDKCVLNSHLVAPSYLVPLNALEAFKATVRDTYAEQDINIDFFHYDAGKDVYLFPRGNMPLLQSIFQHCEFDDQRCVEPMSPDVVKMLEFSGSLRPGQQEVIDSLLEEGITYGQISAPPRFGKTITLVNFTTRLKYKTLFLSHQIDLSKQMLNSFYKFTNIVDVEYELNRPVIGIVEDWSDLDRFDIAIMTYQKFVTGTGADEKLEEYRNKFGAVFVDECHKSNAPRYSTIVSAFNAKVRMGVSGTIERKDKLHVINEYILGPTVVEGKADQVPCKVQIVKTGALIPIRAQSNKFFFTQALTHLSKHRDRNELLFKYILSYAQAGHSIMAISDRIDQIQLITKMLTDAGIKAEEYHKSAFKTKKQREDCLNRMRRGDTQVIVAQRTMTLGLDIPCMTALFNLLPSANKPNYYQETSRVRTPHPGKEVAYIVDFVDEHFIMEACAKTRMKVYFEHGMEIM